MYYCTTCKIMHANKPRYSDYCDYCGSRSITKLANKYTVTIEDIDLNAPFGDLQREFFNYDESQSEVKRHHNWWNQYTPYNNTVIQNILHKRPFGYIIDHMSDFINLNAAELDDLWLKLYGKYNLEYYTSKYVKVKLSHINNYVLVKMKLTDIILWFKNSNTTYKYIYSKIWRLRAITENDTNDDLAQNIREESKQNNQNDIYEGYTMQTYLIS